MNAKFFISVLSLLILLGTAKFASAQNVLLFTFDDSGPNVTATVTGSFDTSGLSFARQATPNPPGLFSGATFTAFSWGATTSTVVDAFEGAIATGNPDGPTFLFNFLHGAVETPLSEYLEINASNAEGFSQIAFAEGETSFNADTLANNVIVFQEGPVEVPGLGTFPPLVLAETFISSTPTTVLTDPNGDNIIQFVLAVPEIILCDVNRDGVVNFEDIGPFIDVLLGGGFQAEADCNQDEEVNFSDIPSFIEILTE